MTDRDPGQFEKELASQVAMEFLREQRTARRWGIFFKLFFAGYLLLLLVLSMGGRGEFRAAGFHDTRFTALVEVDGVIAPDSQASADLIVSGLRAAFDDERTAGVILRINSPGGSPVQAGYVVDELRRLRRKNPEIPVYAVITDLCASGGYYIAAGTDRIYADKASIVGSIGVIMSGFGFVEALGKLGIERRVRHAGENKGFLDPFLPLREEEVAHVDRMLDEIYRQFIAVVKESRGDRLKDDPAIFSGLVWTGEKSLELGLVDGLGSSSYVAREIIGAEEIVDFTRHETYIDRFARRIGAAMAEKLLVPSLGLR
jgi:protease-4